MKHLIAAIALACCVPAFAADAPTTQQNKMSSCSADFKATGSLTYRNGGISTLIQGRYTGGGYHDVGEFSETAPVFIEDNTVEDILYVDFRLGYEFEMSGLEWEVFGNVTNLFDADPPLTPSYSAFLGYSTQHNSAVHDVLGRRFTVGVKVRM